MDEYLRSPEYKAELLRFRSPESMPDNDGDTKPRALAVLQASLQVPHHIKYSHISLIPFVARLTGLA